MSAARPEVKVSLWRCPDSVASGRGSEHEDVPSVRAGWLLAFNDPTALVVSPWLPSSGFPAKLGDATERASIVVLSGLRTSAHSVAGVGRGTSSCAAGREPPAPASIALWLNDQLHESALMPKTPVVREVCDCPEAQLV